MNCIIEGLTANNVESILLIDSKIWPVPRKYHSRLLQIRGGHCSITFKVVSFDQSSPATKNTEINDLGNNNFIDVQEFRIVGDADGDIEAFGKNITFRLVGVSRRVAYDELIWWGDGVGV